jgi:Tfp pilus assembly protein PilF
MKYKDTNMSLPEIAKELNIDAVIEGSVLQAGDSVRIRVQLINVHPEEQNLWGQSYDRAITDVFIMFSEVTRAIVDQIQIKLTLEEEILLASARQVHPQALDFYQKGMFHWGKLTPEDIEIALNYFELAREEDPNFALAYSGIAIVWGVYALIGVMPPQEVAPKAIAAAEKALELDNTLAEVYYVMAGIRTWIEWDWEAGETAFKKAIDLDPNFADVRAYYSHFLLIMNRSDEAMVQIERALEIDPFNPLIQSLYGVDLMYMRRYDEAIEQFQKVLKSVSNHAVAVGNLPLVYYQKRMYEKSLEAMKAAYSFDEVSVKALTLGFEEAGYNGAMKLAAERWEKLSRETYINPFHPVDFYVIVANKEKALEWLEKGFEQGHPNMPYIGITPGYVDLLGDEPRYQDLLRKMNLPGGK